MTENERAHALDNMISSGLHDDIPGLRAWAVTEAATPTLRAWLGFRSRPAKADFFAVDFTNEEEAERDARDLNNRLIDHHQDT
jgi:hypothetical protein